MDIPKAYEPKDVEGRWYPFWEAGGFFKPETQEDADAPVFSMVIPPPNVTGYLHIGHALNHTLQDVLARWRRMSGDRVLWLPGTDHAGIATQMVVERFLSSQGIKRRDLGRQQFVARVWDWREHHGGTIQKQMRTLGESVDWSRERFTLDEGLSSAVSEVFVRLYDEGLIYRGEYLINWSPGLQTAVSDLEVEMKPVSGKLYHIAYPLKGSDGSLPAASEGLTVSFAASQPDGENARRNGVIHAAGGEYIVVATTRPETMLGDTAIAVNPDDDRYRALIGRTVILPLVGRELTIVADDVVEPQFGTGLVKVTPGHDHNDFAIARRHKLELISVIGKDARMTDAVPEKYRGLDRDDARKQIVADLEVAGLLVKVEEYKHNVGHCQRSGIVIEPLLSTQWFMRMKPLAEPALEAVRNGRTTFVPESMSKVYCSWLERIEDWCISRQLWWGHRIPAWYGPAGQIVVARSESEARERWIADGHEASAELRQDDDVLDTWFSSALWPFSTLGWPERTKDLETYYPTSVMVTGPDIIFFWVARMMMMGIKLMGEVPFRTVYINGLVLDPDGQKMSKTRGNVVDPLVIFEKYGTDAARFALISAAAAGMNIKINESKLESARNFVNKIWNAARFVLLNCGAVIDSQEPVEWDTETASPELADRWILSRLNRVALETHDSLADFRFHEAASTLYHFFWDDFCDWYIELAKPYVTSKDLTPENLAVQRRIVYLLEQSLRLLHPILPFVTEELWQRLPHAGQTVCLASFPRHNAAQLDGRAEREMNLVIEMVTRIRNMRSTFNLGPATLLQVEAAPANDAARDVISRNAPQIESLARLQKLAIVDRVSHERGAARAVTSGGEIAISLAGLVDFDKERQRLARDLEKLKQEQTTLEGRLSNASFVERAAPDVVATAQTRLAELRDQIARLEAITESL
jgi:valyl-tRNA synthetase